MGENIRSFRIQSQQGFFTRVCELQDCIQSITNPVINAPWNDFLHARFEVKKVRVPTSCKYLWVSLPKFQRLFFCVFNFYRIIMDVELEFVFSLFLCLWTIAFQRRLKHGGCVLVEKNTLWWCIDMIPTTLI